MAEVGKCTYKVPNGKLLKVTVEFEGGKIQKALITGDFFIHPEESIDELELALKGTVYQRKEITDVVGRFFLTEGLVAFGITPKAVVDALMICREAGK